MKYILTDPRAAFAGLGIAFALSFSSCQSPNYGQALAPGADALIPASFAELKLPIAEQWEAREEILPALERSIKWTQRDHAEKFFPIAGIDHALALASLERFHELLSEAPDRESFAQAFETEFDVFMSAGWDSEGGGVLFTGYCTPLLPGDTAPSADYAYPLYEKPPSLKKDKAGKTLGWETPTGLARVPSRRSIDGNAVLEGQGLELAWLADPVDAYIAHVNGSAFIELPDGELLRLGYSAKNGRPYNSLGKALIEAGHVKAEDMNLSAIRAWAREASTSTVTEYLNRNPSYVFFQPIEGNPHGSLDFEVTADRSLATDKALFPRGALVFVDADIPNRLGSTTPFRKFMFDQDTGGAIRTAGRADIYLGIGPQAEERAGSLKSEGQLYYFFLKARFSE